MPGKYKTLTTVANGRRKWTEGAVSRRVLTMRAIVRGGRFFRGSTPYSLGEWIMLQHCRKPALNIESTVCDSDAGVCFVQSNWVVVGIFYNLLIRVYGKKSLSWKASARQKEIHVIFFSHNTHVWIIHTYNPIVWETTITLSWLSFRPCIHVCRYRFL